MTMAQTVTDPLLLEACVRDELNVTAPRYQTLHINSCTSKCCLIIKSMIVQIVFYPFFY